MSVDLENELRDLGTRLLAAAPAVTTAEVLDHRRGDVPKSDVSSAAIPVAGEPLLLTDITEPRALPRTRRLRRGLLAGSVAAASLLAIGLGVASRGGDESRVAGSVAGSTAIATTPATAGAVVDTPAPLSAQSITELAWPPRVLLDESWELLDVAEHDANEGWEHFGRDGMIVSIGWYRGEINGPEFYEAQGFDEVGTASIFGESVPIYAESPSYRVGDIRALIASGDFESEVFETEMAAEDLADDQLVGGPLLDEALAGAVSAGLIEGVSHQLEAHVVWNASSLGVSMRRETPGAELDLAEFEAVAAALHQVDPAAWEAVLPDNIVTPAQRTTVVEELLSGVPLPEGFTVENLLDGSLVQSRGQVASDLVRLVACAWLHDYFTATDDGRTEAAQPALDAIASIPSWPATQAMDQAAANANPALPGIPNHGLSELEVDDDATITYDGSTDALTGTFAAELCDTNAVG